MAQILKLAPRRRSTRVTMPASFEQVRHILGLGPVGPFTHLELWSTGKSSYVMAVAGKLRVNVSLNVQFSCREDTRTWARVFAEAHRLSPEILIGRRR